MATKQSTTEKEEICKWNKEMKAMAPIFFAQLILSALLTAGILYGGYYHCNSIPVPKSNNFEDTFIYFIRCCVFPCAIVIFNAVVSVIGKRTTTPAANPLAGKEHFLTMEKNFLSNSVEQALIFLMISAVLITYLDTTEMKIIPLYTIVWVVGRILFRIGYGISPLYRSLGMLMHIWTSPIFIALVSYLMYSRGFMYKISSDGGGTARGGADVPLKAEL